MSKLFLFKANIVDIFHEDGKHSTSLATIADSESAARLKINSYYDEKGILEIIRIRELHQIAEFATFDSKQIRFLESTDLSVELIK